MRTLAIFIVALLGLSASAQEYKPIIKDGRMWIMAKIVDNLTDNDEKTIVANVVGDTIVDGRECKKISVRIYHESMRIADAFDKAVYEEDGKLYMHDYYDNENFSLLIDMNMRKGDVIPTESSNINIAVESEDTVDVRGVKRRRIGFDNDFYKGNPLVWIEGVGASIDCYATPCIRTTNWDGMFLLECYDDGKLIYAKDDLRNVPLPTNAVSVSVSKYTHGLVYDILGKRISSTRKGEIYIQNGEKRIGD